MRLFLKKLFVFLLVVPAFYVALLVIWGKVVPRFLQKNLYYVPATSGHILTRLSEADTTKNVDILVLGSSHAYRGFDPRIIEKGTLKTFNLGTSSQTPIQTLYLLNKYIDQLKPKLVLYEVYYSTFQADGVESALTLYSNISKLDRGLLSMSFELNNIKSYNTLLYAYIDKEIFRKTYKEPLVVGLDTYVKGGYIERVITPFSDKKRPAQKEIELIDRQKSAFDKALNLLKQRNIPVILVQAPITNSLYKSYTNSDEVDKYFGSFSDYRYYNFNIDTNFGDDLFFDGHHLNQKGVQRFNQLLLDSLQRDKILIDNKIYGKQ